VNSETHELFERSYRDLSGLSKVLRAFLVISTLFNLGGVWVVTQERVFLQDVVGGMYFLEREIVEAHPEVDARTGLVSMAQTAWVLIVAVVTCVWTYRTNRNARARRSRDVLFAGLGGRLALRSHRESSPAVQCPA